MAIIYETPDDFKREKLGEQANRHRIDSANQNNTGTTFLMGSVLLDLWRRTRESTGKVLGMISIAATIAGVVEYVRSWRSAGKAHDLDLERERLGPQAVVLPTQMMQAPAELQMTETIDPSCGCKIRNVGKRFSKPVEPRSLTDYAQTMSDSNLPTH